MSRNKPRPVRPPNDLTDDDVREPEEDEPTDPDLPRLDWDGDSRWDTPGENGVDSLGAAYLDQATGNDGAPRGQNSIKRALSLL
jgi:hypothetical protein